MDARQLAYLEAMDIDVWVPRGARAPMPGPEDAEPRVVLGRGDSDILCIARDSQEAGLQLASDIGKSMRVVPLWAWPGTDEGVSATVREVVTESLITRILVFGQELSSELFGNETPHTIGAAKVHVVPGLGRLGSDRDAKRTLWALMCSEGIAASQSGGGRKA
jgi:hypothetical protein